MNPANHSSPWNTGEKSTTHAHLDGWYSRLLYLYRKGIIFELYPSCLFGCLTVFPNASMFCISLSVK